MNKAFLTAEWKNLLMINYEIDPAVLLPHLPHKTILDNYNGIHYVSLVGFLFLNTKVLGLKIPFHVNFEEVNLRFYVKRKVNNEWRRGVVFVREIVPKHAIAFVANTLYKEHYSAMPMRHQVIRDEVLQVNYGWKYKGSWDELGITTNKSPIAMKAGSLEEFIAEHYWGYNRVHESKTTEYKVEHPKWNFFPSIDYTVSCRFSELYGNDFDFLSDAKPLSVFMADGSGVSVGHGSTLK
ncbi:MAG: DUF2071 domain-containing protein [Chitinophagaceae bacterium]|nr:DUF2071 domain-containing protein [Chitinophagaceae bacterium]